MDKKPTAQQRFIDHFGAMGQQWGISRTTAQTYALLYLSEQPLCTDDVLETLQFARSNVSTAIKELLGWRLIQSTHLPGDRKTYFTAQEDPWDLVRTLIEERKRREIDPTLAMLRDIISRHPSSHDHAHQRMHQMHDLMEQLTQWYDDMAHMSTDRLLQLLQLGSRVYRLYELKHKLKAS